MTNIEPAVVRSFRHVKTDVVRLQSDLLCLAQTQERMVEHINGLRKKIEGLTNKNGYKAAVKKRNFVASKNRTKFHIAECPFAKNIKPKSKLTFHSKVKALNEGFKPCKCLA